MKFKNFREKFTVSFIGIITFFLLLEIFLRIIGSISSKRLDHQPTGNSYNDAYIILCLGDSYTFGIGAPSGMDYPSQLEAMLNSRAGNKKFKVINRGMNGYNTTQMLNRLKDTLKKGIKPNLVTLLGGGANYWNYRGYHIFLEGRTPSAIVSDYLYRIRTYKLARLLFLNIKDKINSKLVRKKIESYLSQENLAKPVNYYAKGRSYKEQRQYDEAIKWFKKGIEAEPNNSDCYLGLGTIYNEQCQYDEAIRWLEKCIEIEPRRDACYSAMAFSYLNKDDYEKALLYVKKAIKLNPGNINHYNMLFLIYTKLRRYEGGLNFLNELAENNLIPEEVIDILKKINNKEDIPQEVRQWIVSDIETIIKICKENKIKILLLDYPFNSMTMPADLFYNIAKDNSVPFASNYQIFRKLREAGEKREDYFVPDGHCNAKGYAIIARNIFDKIIQEKMFDE